MAVILRGQCSTHVGDAIYYHLQQNLFDNLFKFAKINVAESEEFTPNIEKLRNQLFQDLLGKSTGNLRDIVKKDSVFIYIDNILSTQDLRRILGSKLKDRKKVRLLIRSPNKGLSSALTEYGFEKIHGVEQDSVNNAESCEDPALMVKDCLKTWGVENFDSSNDPLERLRDIMLEVKREDKCVGEEEDAIARREDVCVIEEDSEAKREDKSVVKEDATARRDDQSAVEEKAEEKGKGTIEEDAKREDEAVLQEKAEGKGKVAVEEDIKRKDKGEVEDMLVRLGFCLAFEYTFQILPLTAQDAFLDICYYFLGWDWNEVSVIVGKEELETLEANTWVTKNQRYQITVPQMLVDFSKSKTKVSRISIKDDRVADLFRDKVRIYPSVVFFLFTSPSPFVLTSSWTFILASSQRISKDFGCSAQSSQSQFLLK